MTDRPLELEDDLLSARLASACGPPPAGLHARLARLTAVGLPATAPVAPERFAWREAAPRWIGLALLVALSIAILPRLVAWFANPPQSQGVAALLAGSGALGSLMLPLGILLGVEAMRGAPTVRGWLR